MRRTRIPGLALGVWLAACLPAQAVVLRYAPKLGARTTSTQTTSGRIETTTGGSTVQMDLTSRAAYSREVLEQVPEGVKVRTKRQNGILAIGLPAATEKPKPEKLPDSTIVTVIDTQGRVVTVLAADRRASQSLTGDLFISFGGAAVLPKEEVSPDDSWTDTLAVPAIGDASGYTLTVAARLLGLSTYNGHPCAKISATFRGPLSWTPEAVIAHAGTGASLAGTLEGATVGFYDYQESVWRYQRTDASATMVVTPAGKDASDPEAMATKLTLHATTTLAR